MLEPLILGLFSAGLLSCVIFGWDVLYALAFGYALFFGYGIYRRCSLVALLQQSAKGVGTVKNILINMLLIGSVTALWRAGGTIPYIVQHATRFIAPATVLCLTFLLCCLLSCLTGTSFGTAATMGVIAMTMATNMGVSPVLAGGAVLAGSYFGDRWSPMSTSALLVNTLTDITSFDNLRGMMRTILAPFLFTCAIYLALGWVFPPQMTNLQATVTFADYFHLHPITALPALLIIVLSVCRVEVKKIMLVSIVVSACITIFVQGISPTETLRIAIWGFLPTDATLATMLSGGGVVSMLHVVFVVCISSCYAGLFAETQFLNGFLVYIRRVAEKCNPFFAVLLTSIPVSMISCNQTLAIMLTHQLCESVEPDHHRMAVYLENSVVVLAPLIPWSIAGTVPLASVGAPLSAMSMAVFLYVLPLYTLFLVQRGKKIL